LGQVDGLSGPMQISMIVQRNEQRELFEPQAAGELRGGDGVCNHDFLLDNAKFR
jgi:hypothetical protein